MADHFVQPIIQIHRVAFRLVPTPEHTHGGAGRAVAQQGGIVRVAVLLILNLLPL